MITDLHVFDLGNDAYRVTANVDGNPVQIRVVKSVLQTLATQAQRQAVVAYLLRIKAQQANATTPETEIPNL